MKKRNIITAAIILTLALVLSLAACSPKQSEAKETEVPTETMEVTEATEVATEPTEVATEPAEVATEPEETEPDDTKPVTTSKPGNSASTNTSIGTNTGNGSNGSGTTTVVPPVTEPASVETPNVTPVPTPTEPVPAVTEPAPTEHIHSWQEVYHEAVTHTDVYYVCNCGARFPTLDAQTAHTESFYGNGEEAIKHFNYHTEGVEVVDTPAYSTWVCACGATSDTQP